MKPVGDIMCAYVARLEGRPTPAAVAALRRVDSGDRGGGSPRALASRLVRERQFDQAWPMLAAQLDTRPDDAFLWRRLGKAARDAGYVVDAVRCYDRALALEPGEPWGVMGRAEALSEVFDVACGELLEALDQLRALHGRAVPTELLRCTGMVLRAIERRSGHPFAGALAAGVRVQEATVRALTG